MGHSRLKVYTFFDMQFNLSTGLFLYHAYGFFSFECFVRNYSGIDLIKERGKGTNVIISAFRNVQVF